MLYEPLPLLSFKGKDERELKIPAIRDRIVQEALLLVLQPIFDVQFLDCSYGYRPGRSAHKAIARIERNIKKGRHWIVDADIKGFFDSIDHEWMIRMLEERISDGEFLNLIRKWLKAGILEEDGKVINPVTGTPQGGSISAILANIYLHYALDLWFVKRIAAKCRGDVSITRFADDFICCFQYADEAEAFYEALRTRLSKFKLNLSEDKCKIVRFTKFITSGNDSFTFLGFEYRWSVSRKGNPVIRLKTSKKKLKLALNSIKEWIRNNRSLKLKELMARYRQKLQGHWNYYGVCGNFSSMNSFFWKANRIVLKWLNRRGQRKSYSVDGFEIMLKHFNIPPPRIIAR